MEKKIIISESTQGYLQAIAQVWDAYGRFANVPSEICVDNYLKDETFCNFIDELFSVLNKSICQQFEVKGDTITI